MDKHLKAKEKLFEAIGVKIGIYGPYQGYVKNIRSKKNHPSTHLYNSIEYAWENIILKSKNSNDTGWDKILISAKSKPQLIEEVSILISSFYFETGNTGLLTSIIADGVKQSVKEINTISHLKEWT